MDVIQGKVLVFTDLHLGLKSASKTRLDICIKVIDKIVSYIQQNDIKTAIFCGDWNHVRSSTENNVLNVSYNLMKKLSSAAKVYCILGNHDLYLKNSTELTSLVIFKDLANVKIVYQPYELSINGNRTLLVPWLSNVSGFQKCTYDMLFGHFDISQKFLISSYASDNSSNVKAEGDIASKINADSILASNDGQQDDKDYEVKDFIDTVKLDGTIFSGHIHAHRELITKKRKFIFVGDPYQQNLGERMNKCGFYVIDDSNHYSFKEIDGIPKHVELKMSEVQQHLGTFDFSIVKGNIVHKTYDIEVDRIEDAKISQKINDWQPYEELLPDYDAASYSDSQNGGNSAQNESIDLIRKSKLDYIKNYITNIDQAVLDEQDIQKDKLFDVLKGYYDKVSEEK